MKKKRSICPVACTLDIVGDKWTLLVIRDLFAGKQYFKDFSASPEGIATNILTNRLDRLLEHGLIEQFLPKGESAHYAYRLTNKGKTLEPVLRTVADWGLSHIKGTEMRIVPAK